MEAATPLALYLEKLASGDPELAPMICQKLSQQLVYVPVVTGGRSKTDGKLVFQVVKLPEGNVPVFTTEQQYKSWAAAHTEPTEVFTVLGGDLCATVGERATVVLDIGAAHTSVLTIALMQLVADAARDTFITERLTPPAPGSPPPQSLESKETTKSLLPTIFSNTSQPLDGPARGSTEPIFDPLRGRSNPTSIMARPQRPRVDMDKDVHHRKNVRENHRPVITTQDPDSAKLIRSKEDPKKSERRSLLKFLGG